MKNAAFFANSFQSVKLFHIAETFSTTDQPAKNHDDILIAVCHILARIAILATRHAIVADLINAHDLAITEAITISAPRTGINDNATFNQISEISFHVLSAVLKFPAPLISCNNFSAHESDHVCFVHKYS